MSRILVFLLPAFVVFFLVPPASAGPRASPRDPVFEQQIAQELRAIAPDAPGIFERGTAAIDAGDAASAVDLFSQVLALAPGFSHAERRKCGALAVLGRRDEALPLCRSALAQSETAANEAALSEALVATKGVQPDAADLGEATRLAFRAADAKNGDPYYWR